MKRFNANTGQYVDLTTEEVAEHEALIKEAILRAFRHVLIISALLILPSIYPLYLMTGIVNRQIQQKVN